MDRLEENLKRIMQVASVIGREFAFRILQAISGMREGLKAQLLNLQGLEFIYEKNLFPELEYIFKHALTQEVAYNSLLLKRRKEIHERIGQAIETIYPDRLPEFYEMLAYHYARGDNAQKAYLYLKLSGDKARESYANREAIRFYREAIEILDRQPQSDLTKQEKLRVILALSRLAGFSVHVEGYLDLLLEGERLSTELTDERSLASVHRALGQFHSWSGNPSLAIRYIRKSFEGAVTVEDLDLMAPTALELGNAYHAMGKPQEIVDHLPTVVALLEKCAREGDSFGTRYKSCHSGLCAICGSAFGLLGEFEKGKAFQEKGLRTAASGDDKHGILINHFNRAYLSFCEGDARALVVHAEQSVKIFEEIQGGDFWGPAWSLLGVGHAMLGEHDVAGDCAGRGVARAKESGPFLMAVACSNVALVYVLCGDLQSAEQFAREGLELSQKFDSPWVEASARMMSGRVLGKRNPHGLDDAVAQVTKAIGMFEMAEMKARAAMGYLTLGEIYADAGKREQAAANLKRAEGMYREMGVIPESYWLRRAREATERL
jgi:tetratricopeptide (TPR) repeat protein